MCWKSSQKLFTGEGNLLNALRVETDLSYPLVQLRARHVLLVVKEKLRKEQRRLKDLNVITPVNFPTKWISATVVTLKKHVLEQNIQTEVI